MSQGPGCENSQPLGYQHAAFPSKRDSSRLFSRTVRCRAGGEGKRIHPQKQTRVGLIFSPLWPIKGDQKAYQGLLWTLRRGGPTQHPRGTPQKKWALTKAFISAVIEECDQSPTSPSPLVTLCVSYHDPTSKLLEYAFMKCIP